MNGKRGGKEGGLWLVEDGDGDEKGAGHRPTEGINESDRSRQSSFVAR